MYSKANSSWLSFWKQWMLSARGWPVKPAFIHFHLCCWLTWAIFCFVSVYIWKDTFLDFRVLHSDVGIEGWKRWKCKSVISGQLFKCWQVKACWQSLVLSGENTKSLFTTSYYPNHNPTALLSTQPILWLKDNAPAATDIQYVSIMKTNVFLTCAAGNKAMSCVHQMNSTCSDS